MNLHTLLLMLLFCAGVQAAMETVRSKFYDYELANKLLVLRETISLQAFQQRAASKQLQSIYASGSALNRQKRAKRAVEKSCNLQKEERTLPLRNLD
ncbi:hypothetical protein M514_05442 [Trichuris suis]|uniref:Uncharacterized protein n=1 Tax=Trichuris suis TaxID=68888 RepID=A0A085NSK6_9BILA|nr:hypothetical protein M513_05442 [Trichuris suis]KFD72452.1 hypothetical protein M514_05442 [Trichuris suis]